MSFLKRPRPKSYFKAVVKSLHFAVLFLAICRSPGQAQEAKSVRWTEYIKRMDAALTTGVPLDKAGYWTNTAPNLHLVRYTTAIPMIPSHIRHLI
jgi:hypothetical protein